MLFPDDAVRRQVSKTPAEYPLQGSTHIPQSGTYNFALPQTAQAIQDTAQKLIHRVVRIAGTISSLPRTSQIRPHRRAHCHALQPGWHTAFMTTSAIGRSGTSPNFSGLTPQQFYEMYAKVSRALKALDPSLKVGTDANAAPLNDGPYREDLFDYIRRTTFPLISIHAYLRRHVVRPLTMRCVSARRRAVSSTPRLYQDREHSLRELEFGVDFTKTRSLT